MKTDVLNINPGQTVKFHRKPCIVLEHRAEGTLLLDVECVEHIFGSTNNFAASSLRDYLNSTYLDAQTESHPDDIITRTVNLTALNGSKEYGTCECKVAPLSLDEIRKYHGLLPKPDEKSEWSVTPWNTPKVNGDYAWVVGLDTYGGIDSLHCSVSLLSHPAFLVPSNYAVENDNDPLKQYTIKELLDEISSRVIE